MTKLRVYELARELNVETKVLLARLKTGGVKVASHQSTLTDQQVADLRSAFGGKANGAAQAAAPAAAPATTDASKPRVVIRRRAATSDESPAGVDASSGMDEAPVHEPELPRPTVAPKPTIITRPAAVAKAPEVELPPPPMVEDAEPEDQDSEVIDEPAPAHEPDEVEDEPAVVAAPVPAAPAVARVEVAAPPPAPTPPAPVPAAPQQAGAADARIVTKRREVGGATIVRRATQEEKDNLESLRQRQTGRKEDHRGTRVTGLGLLSNRISADGPGGAPAGGQTGPGGAPPSGPPPGVDVEEWNRRTAAAGGHVKDKKTLEEEEAARKRAAQKARRTNIAMSTRALLDQAEILTSDEEVKTNYQGRTVYTPTAPRTRREVRRRKDLKKTQITTPRASYRVVEMAETITVGELAHQLSIKATELIKKLMGQGVMATINQAIDFDTATLVAHEYGFEVKSNVQTAEDVLAEHADTDLDTVTRAPIVTIMGHVDHGKTSILDAIRAANVAGGEAGGITQHIGAYSVDHDGEKITFLDTPGHEAFSAMRARGAKVTDIVVLVVAADDGVMPQTVEAINHAKDAGVPIIVAVNKIDKPNINLDRVYTELTEHGIQAEEWGGETQFIKVSALQRIGLDQLLEAIVLQAEVLDLKAPLDGKAEGVVIEAHLDKGRGPVATIVVQSGTLRSGDYIVAGTEIGRVRNMHDHLNRQLKEALPSDPAEIIGLSGVPMAGDKFNVCSDEKTAREIADMRLAKARALAGTKSSAASLEDLLARVKTADVPEVPMIIKGDTQGSVEAIRESILKLNTPKVKNRIVHAAVGGVTESDITLAAASGSVLIGFNVRAARGLDELAEKQGVLIKYFGIIYEIVDTVKSIMVGKLPPIVSEVVLGHAEVRKPISVPKIGTIAGSAVLDGKITRSSHCRLIRDSVVIYQGKLQSLRRFKDDVKEVAMGYECGIGIDGYNDLREGDVIEAFVLEETAATL